MTKSSKRARKSKEQHSLAVKQRQGEQSGLDLLSDELKQQLLDSGKSAEDLLILPASKANKDGHGKGAGTEQQQPPPQQPMSKSEQRKLKQIQAKQERRQNLSQVLSSLHSSGLSDAQLALLRPLHQRGAQKTRKQQEHEASLRRQAGLEVPESPRRSRAEEDEEDEKRAHAHEHTGLSTSGSEESDSEDERPQAAKGPAPQAKASQPQQQQQSAAAAANAAAVAAAAERAKREAQEREEAEERRKREEASEEPAKKRARLRSAAEAGKAEARREAGYESEGDEDNKPAVGASVPAQPGMPHRVVHLERPADIDAVREGLPIVGMEQEVMEAVMAHDVIVLCGETGCGKTTQVPQFLLEAGYGCPDFPERAGNVGVTQPRRVAATSTAARVAAELGTPLGQMVGYQVRYDRHVGPEARLKFMTDGILLRELQEDFLLRRYSVLIVDEAHERTLNTDLLLGLLSRLVPLRRKLHDQQRAQPGYSPDQPGAVFPLKLLIMSATLRTEDFVENRRLFPKPPPLLQVPARQFPVTVHFARRTEVHDYVGAAYRKVCRIHKELPPGGVLVFLNGQREVEHLCHRLREHFAPAKRRHHHHGPARTAGGPAAGSAAGPSADPQATHSSGGAAVGGAAATPQARLAAAAAAAAAAADKETEAEACMPDSGLLGHGFGGDQAEVAHTKEEGALDAAGMDADDFDEMNRSEDEDEEKVEVLGEGCMSPEAIAEAERTFEQLYGFGSNSDAPGDHPPQLGTGSSTTPSQSIGGLGGVPGQAQAGGEPEEPSGPPPVHVLPLYAVLPAAAQARVFQPPPAGHRLIVVATNVAETSLTIPGIRYVVDAGRSKQRLIDVEAGGASRFEVRWISQAAAQQRAGRAGRTGPGHCYRLFSSAHFTHIMPRHAPPEILNTPLESVVLVMKSMGVDKVANFPFPSPPEAASLRAAMQALVALGAVHFSSGALTTVGKAMAVLPVSPRHARMLLEVAAWQLGLVGAAAARETQPSTNARGSSSSSSNSGGASGAVGGPRIESTVPGMGAWAALPSAATAAEALPLAVALTAVLSVESPFVHVDTSGLDDDAKPADDKEGAEEKGSAAAAEDKKKDTQEKEAKRARAKQVAAAHSAFRCSTSDALGALRVLCAYEAAEAEEEGGGSSFCSAHHLHLRHLREAADLHRQLLRILGAPTLTTDSSSAGTKAHKRSNKGSANTPDGNKENENSSSTRGGALVAQLSRTLAAGQGSGVEQMVHAACRRGHQVPVQLLDCLRRAIAAGWADQVAHRIRRIEHVQRQLHQPHGKRHAVRYAACSIPNSHATGAAGSVAAANSAAANDEWGGDVFLHPRSVLHSSAPEFVVFSQVVRTAKRPYMGGVTAIEPHWLVQSRTPLAVLSPPLSDPPPVYRPLPTDAVLAWHDAKYGMHEWPLPPCLQPLEDATSAAAVFATALLEGRVVPGFAELRPLLLSPPSVIMRPEMRGIARIAELILALASRKVSSLRSLAAVWQQQPRFLLPELLAWLPRARQEYFATRLWPVLVSEAGEVLKAHQQQQQKQQMRLEREQQRQQQEQRQQEQEQQQQAQLLQQQRQHKQQSGQQRREKKPKQKRLQGDGLQEQQQQQQEGECAADGNQVQGEHSSQEHPPKKLKSSAAGGDGGGTGGSAGQGASKVASKKKEGKKRERLRLESKATA